MLTTKSITQVVRRITPEFITQSSMHNLRKVLQHKIRGVKTPLYSFVLYPPSFQFCFKWQTPGVLISNDIIFIYIHSFVHNKINI